MPHTVRVSFDLAWCPCGWHWADDDRDRLELWAEAHREAWAGHWIEMEELTDP